jgi:hypothetical protein
MTKSITEKLEKQTNDRNRPFFLSEMVTVLRMTLISCRAIQINQKTSLNRKTRAIVGGEGEAKQ